MGWDGMVGPVPAQQWEGKREGCFVTPNLLPLTAQRASSPTSTKGGGGEGRPLPVGFGQEGGQVCTFQQALRTVSRWKLVPSGVSPGTGGEKTVGWLQAPIQGTPLPKSEDILQPFALPGDNLPTTIQVPWNFLFLVTRSVALPSFPARLVAVIKPLFH